MLSALFSFFGGTAFRWLFGEVIGFMKAGQEHAHELELRKLDMQADVQRAELRKAEIQAAADAGVKMVEATREAASEAAADLLRLRATEGIDKPSGVAWIDGFNKLIRPELAQVSILLLVGHAIWPEYVHLEGIVLEVVCGVLGLFIGERIRARGA